MLSFLHLFYATGALLLSRYSRYELLEFYMYYLFPSSFQMANIFFIMSGFNVYFQGCKSGLLKKSETLLHQRKYRSHVLNCIKINQSEASIYSLLRKVSDYSDNLNLI